MKKIIAFCVAGLITLSADAAILRLDFSGYVGNVSGTPTGVPTIRETDIQAGIQGDPVSGMFLIDTSAATLVAFDPVLGNAVYRSDFISASTFSVAGLTFNSDDIPPVQISSLIGVSDDPATDAYTLTYQRLVTVFDLYSLGFSTQAKSGNTGLTNGLGLDQPLLGAFLGGSNINSFIYNRQSTGTNLALNYVLTDAQITEVSAVPLPAALWLFGSGLLGLVTLARKGRQCNVEFFA